MHYHYFSSIHDQDYLGRILIFAKRNFWLYIPDLTALIFLTTPPYTWLETKIIIGILLIFSVRDILLLIYSVNHIGKFIIDGDSVSIAILHKSNLHNQYNGNVSDFDLKVRGWFLFKKLFVYKNNELIHCQYVTGNWSPKKLDELYEQFYHFKRDIGFWRIFKGPMVN